MTYDELNKYFLHYVTEDKTHSAVMLTGDWGTGKSFYIQNKLKPFLESKENGKHQCVIVSLYGLQDTAEISKNIYLGIRLKFLRKNTEKTAAAILTGKTVINNIAGYLGIDLSIDETKLKKLYQSVDLSGKLIVLEDLERSGINILKVLGFVNNMVEHDGVKVLLVANETELLTTETKEITKNGRMEVATIYTEKASHYLRTKEKTVGDTIVFMNDFKSSIDTILWSFNNSYINKMLEPVNEYGEKDAVRIITDIMKSVNIYNLRSLLFGCQKTVDLFSYVDDSFDADFLASILYSNIAFALKQKSNDSMIWERQDELSSAQMGTPQYPMYKVAYDFIKFQFCDKKALVFANKFYIAQKEYQMNNSILNEYLNTLYFYFEHTENEVIEALEKILYYLENTNEVSCIHFSKIASSLIAINRIIGYDEEILRCKEAMIRHIKEKGDAETERDLRMHTAIEFDSKDDQKEHSSWVKEMYDVCRAKSESQIDFDYCPEHIDNLEAKVYANTDSYLEHHCFARIIDTNRLIEMLKKSNPLQIHTLRGIYSSVYSFSNLNEYFTGDKSILEDLKNKVDDLIDSPSIIDRIVKKQLSLFSKDLQVYIDRIKR